MTCPAFRTLLTALDHALNFAAFLVHPIAGWNAAADELYLRAVRPRDGAERLAEAEAETEVGEPNAPEAGQLVGGDATINSGLILRSPIVPPLPSDSSIFRSGGQTKETGPRPRLSTPGPRITDSDRLDTLIGLREDIYGQLENVAAQLEEVRNLLLEDGRGHGKDGGQRAEWSSGADFLSSPPSQSSSPATGRSLPPIPVYPASNRVNPDSSCAVGDAQCCGPAAQESPAAGFEWLTPPAAGQPRTLTRDDFLDAAEACRSKRLKHWDRLADQLRHLAETAPK